MLCLVRPSLAKLEQVRSGYDRLSKGVMLLQVSQGYVMLGHAMPC